MEKIIEIMNEMSNEELKELKDRIKKGEIDKAIKKKLERFKTMRICPVCNTPVSEEGITLLFGPQGFRKKAIFDGLDCLEYFISKLKEA